MDAAGLSLKKQSVPMSDPIDKRPSIIANVKVQCFSPSTTDPSYVQQGKQERMEITVASLTSTMWVIQISLASKQK